jgi:hypothetical protein
MKGKARSDRPLPREPPSDGDTGTAPTTCPQKSTRNLGSGGIRQDPTRESSCSRMIVGVGPRCSFGDLVAGSGGFQGFGRAGVVVGGRGWA